MMSFGTSFMQINNVILFTKYIKKRIVACYNVGSLFMKGDCNYE